MQNSPKPTPSGFHRIVIVDDHPMVREGLGNVIAQEAGLEVCGEADDRFDALRVVDATLPDLVMVDLTLKNSSGLDLIKDLKVMHPDVKILVISMQEESHYAERVLRAGAHGYMTKQEATRNVLKAIQQVMAGDIYVSPVMATKITSSLLGKKRTDGQFPIESLADRELQVFELLGTGFSTREIANNLHLEVKTIETYRARIKEKLGIRDASELLRVAIAWSHRLA